jgi:gp16 family phage-associated protein
MITKADREKAKQRLLARGETLKQWCEQNGHDYETASKIMQGVRKGNYGKGHEIAVALGLKAAIKPQHT